MIDNEDYGDVCDCEEKELASQEATEIALQAERDARDAAVSEYHRTGTID